MVRRLSLAILFICIGLSATEDFSQGTGDETEPKMKKTKSVLRAPSDPLLAWQIEYAELTVGEQLGAGAFGAVS